jgi:hypothetical protein
MSQVPAYCDFNFAGRVELVPESHLVFNSQRVDLPNGQNLLFPRLSPDGSRFAGIGHQDGKCWEWTGQWNDMGPTHGTQSVIYDATGVLHVVRGPGEHPGSQGWRYVAEDGRLIASWETYDPTTPLAQQFGVTHLWEWTACGDVIFGQGGDEGGLQALVAGRRVLLDTGDCRFIHPYREGDRFAAAYVRAGESEFHEITRAELDQLPTFEIPSEPPIDPPPSPEEPAVPDSLLPLVEQVFARRLGSLSRPATVDECAAVMNEVAWLARADGWGLSKKPGGNHGTQPRTDIPIAYDILQHKPSDTLWDALGPSEDPTPKWGEAEPHHDPNRPWIAPVEPLAGGDDGDPGDEDDGQGEDEPKPPVCACKAEIAKLTADVAELEQVLVDAAKAANERLTLLEMVKDKPVDLPELVARGKVFGLRVELPVVSK